MKAFTIWQPLLEKYSCSYSNLVQAWALSQYEKMSLLVGMRRASSVEDTAKCVNIELSATDIASMEECIRDIQETVLDK